MLHVYLLYVCTGIYMYMYMFVVYNILCMHRYVHVYFACVRENHAFAKNNFPVFTRFLIVYHR